MRKDLTIQTRMEGILHWINENYDQPISVNDFAAQLHISPASFSRYFRDFTHMKFTDYINRMRIAHAKQSLLNTDQAVTDIALMHGFGSLSAFGRTFMQYEHCTPSAWRKDHAGEQKRTASRPKTETIEADIPDRRGFFWEKSWLKAINIGEARHLLHLPFRKQLEEAVKCFGFSHARIWGIFSESIFPRKSYLEPVPDFMILDRVIDCLLENGLTPWIDLFKPEELYLSDSEAALDPENAILIDLYSSDRSVQISDVCDRLFVHWFSRYGAKTVSAWKFDLALNASFGELDVHILESHIRLYEKIREKLNRWFPGVQMGAFNTPVLERTDLLDALLSRWPQSLPMDYLSVYVFPYTGAGARDNARSKLHKITFTKDRLDKIRELLDRYHMSQVPICITEWNLTFTHNNAINDSCARAAILLANAEETIGSPCPVFLYSLNDIARIRSEGQSSVFGGSGIYTEDHLKKPVWFALDFMRRMSDYCIGHGKGYIITTDRAGRCEILLYHAAPLPELYYQLAEYEITNAFVATVFPRENSDLHFRITLHTRYDRYQMRRQQMVSCHNDLLGTIASFGDVRQADPNDLEWLAQSIHPDRTLSEIAAPDHRLCLEMTLSPYDIVLITLRPVL